jgi:hypothetical protein
VPGVIDAVAEPLYVRHTCRTQSHSHKVDMADRQSISRD